MWDKTRYALASIATVVFAMLVITWLVRLVLDIGFDLNLDHKYWLRDYLGNLSVALIFLVLVKRVAGTLLLSSVLIIGFQLANGAKLAVLGTPTSPDDFINIKNLFFLVDGWQRIAMFAIVLLPGVLALWLVRWRNLTTWITFALLGLGITAVAANSKSVQRQLDRQFGNSVWNQPENFKRRGLALHLTQESVRTLAKVGKTPTAEQVADISSELPENSIDTTQIARRNVHLILLETFFDPMTLGAEWVPEDPFPPEFRKLWASTDNSEMLSPVFGGYTANAEFEVLCGFPVTENAVFFEGWLRRDVPCLPAVLAEAGFHTVASHPNVAGFWNRTHAYKLTGFKDYLSKSRYDTSDSVGTFLLDHSYYEQTFDLLGKLAEGPVFNYMVTYHGHLPYPTNENYPDMIKAGRDDEALLHGYLNQLWYKSRDLMTMLEQLRSDDPDALIVLFGDHLPFLGPNYGVYDEVLGLPKDRDEFTGEMLEFLVSTPLIVIDGERGPLPIGKVPLYRLPSLILKLLGSENGGMFDWTINPEGKTVRPVYGMHISLDGDSILICEPGEEIQPGCEVTANWMKRTRTLIADIFTGKQYSLEKLKPIGDS
ncbi:MAG: LTA synthase family protein [Granulosicoccus sp.]